MSSNKQVIESYLTSTGTDYARLLADDVELIEWGEGGPATGIRTQGKAAYVENRGGGNYETRITRLTEENNVVVAEGVSWGTKPQGGSWRVQFCDIFELENGKVKRLSAFGASVRDSD
jgi:uncharacterized protein